MLIDVIKSLVLGICLAVPIGPVLLLVMQKTLSRGRWVGLVTSLGSTFVDTLYSAIGLFTLALIKDFILDEKALIMIIGGFIIVCVGISMAFRKQKEMKERGANRTTAAGFAFQCAGCAFSNPAALVVALAMLSSFGLSADTLRIPIWLSVVCVAAGELSYWNLVTYALVHFSRFSPRTINIISRVAGTGIAIFGIILVVKGFIAL